MTRLPPSPAPLLLRRLRTADAKTYRELRLEGLQSHPEAFGASWEEEAAHPIGWFADRMEQNVIVAGGPAGSTFMRIVGLLAPQTAKQRHKGVIWGMFVRPQARGTGLAAALLSHVLDEARDLVEEVRLTVVTSNLPAARLYAGFGFEQYGVEKRALQIDSRYYDESLMALKIGGSKAGASPDA